MTIQGTYASAGIRIPTNAGRAGAVRRNLRVRSRRMLDFNLTFLSMDWLPPTDYLGFGRMAAAELMVACRLRA
jgi:hypothetical protein